jgi:hypothetical protein
MWVRCQLLQPSPKVARAAVRHTQLWSATLKMSPGILSILYSAAPTLAARFPLPTGCTAGWLPAAGLEHWPGTTVLNAVNSESRTQLGARPCRVSSV